MRLHRKDPRATIRGANEDLKSENGEDSKELEMRAIAKAERDAKRDVENAKVAPSTGRNRGARFKKTEQVFRTDLTEEQKAKAKLHYEEALPWHLEDDEGKNNWVGNYEDALSNTYAMIAVGEDGRMRVAPLEKWYKFSEKTKFAVFDTDQAETMMKRKVKEPRWFMNSEEAKQKQDSELRERRMANKLFIGKEGFEKGDGRGNPAIKQETADADDLDFVEDRFADDEENMVFEEDQDRDTKEAEERIKKDQLQANVFGIKEEKDYDKQEELEKKEKEAQRVLGKKVKKALKKREKNYIYDSDSDENPYTSATDSDSASDSSATERRKAQEKEKENGKDTPKSTPDRAEKSKAKSLKPNSGRVTPSNRPSKHPNSSAPISRVASTSNLKRPGSPLASDASGNESTRSRKKAKKTKSTANLAAYTAAQLNNPNRPDSPPLVPDTTVAGGTKRRAGNGSDTEAGSGGEMSDGAKARKRQKLKLRMGSASGSLNGSRAGSPTVDAVAVNGSYDLFQSTTRSRSIISLPTSLTSTS